MTISEQCWRAIATHSEMKNSFHVQQQYDGGDNAAVNLWATPLKREFPFPVPLVDHDPLVQVLL